MKKRKLLLTKTMHITIALFAALCVVAILIHWGIWELVELANHLILNLAALFVGILCAVLGVWSVIILYKNVKNHKALAAIPLLILTFTILLFTVIPLTNVYIYINYKFNEKAMENVVELLQKKSLPERTHTGIWFH